MDTETIIPALGMLTGIIVPVSVFIWLYFESKDKNKTILEISKNIDTGTIIPVIIPTTGIIVSVSIISPIFFRSFQRLC